jgi:tetratricopeptide (TPR) repeat protein
MLVFGNIILQEAWAIPATRGALDREERLDFLFYYNRALESLGEHRWTEAIEHLSRAIRLKPDFVPALVNRGNIYLETGDLDRARTDYENALNLEPDDPFARNNLGLVYLNSDRNEEAIQQFSRAIAADEEYAEAYFNRGLAFVNAKKTPEALRDLDRALRLFELEGDLETAGKIREVRRRVLSSGRSG